MSVNRTELVAAVAERSSLTKSQADAALSALQDVLVESVSKGEAVKITGLLSVERVERAARTGRNPQTGAEIQIPAGYGDRKSTRLNSSHVAISYAVFCLKKKKK